MKLQDYPKAFGASLPMSKGNIHLGREDQKQRSAHANSAAELKYTSPAVTQARVMEFWLSGCIENRDDSSLA